MGGRNGVGHDAQYILETDTDLLAQRLMQEFDGDAAIVAWGRADVEADCGHLELSHKWINVMQILSRPRGIAGSNVRPAPVRVS